jgi:hypothetical protein
LPNCYNLKELNLESNPLTKLNITNNKNLIKLNIKNIETSKLEIFINSVIEERALEIEKDDETTIHYNYVEKPANE